MKLLMLIVLCTVLSCHAIKDQKEKQKKESKKDQEKVTQRTRCPEINNNEYQTTLNILQRSSPVPMTQRTSDIKRIYKKISTYKFEHGIVHDPYLGKRVSRIMIKDKILLPVEEIKDCIKSFYQNSKGDGAKKLVHTICQFYYGIGEKRIQAVLNCLEEHRRINPRFDNKAPEKAIIAQNVVERHQIDLVDLSSIPVTINDDRYNYVLSVLDVFSRFLWLRPLMNKRAETVACELYKIFLEYGPPRIIQSDQGGEFKGVVRTLCARLTTRLIYSSSNHPQSQGKDERSHGTWKEKLRRDIIHPQSDDICNWVSGLPVLQRIYNEGHHTAIDMSPYECLFGIKSNHVRNRLSNNENLDEDDLEVEVNEQEASRFSEDDYTSHLKILEDIRGKASAKTTKHALKMIQRNLKRNPPSEYSIGEEVYVKRIGKDKRVSRGGTSITGPKAVEGTVVDRNLEHHKYKVHFKGTDGKEEKKWISVSQLTSKCYKKEKAKKEQAKASSRKTKSQNRSRQMYDFQLSTLLSLQKLLQESVSENNKGKIQKMSLLQNAREFGLEIHSDNSGNGDCMFMALSHQFLTHGLSIDHLELRQILVKFLRENPVLRSQTSSINLRDFVHGYDDFDAYLSSMETPGTWGDNIMLIAAANHYNARIIVISSLQNGQNVVIEPANHEPVFDIYLGHLHELHYISLMQSSQEEIVNETGNTQGLCDECGDFYDTISNHVHRKEKTWNPTHTFSLEDDERNNLIQNIKTLLIDINRSQKEEVEEEDRSCLLAKDHISMVWASFMQQNGAVYEEVVLEGEYFLRVPDRDMDIYLLFRDRLGEICNGLHLKYATRTIQSWMKELSDTDMEEIQFLSLPFLYLVTRRIKDLLDEWLFDNDAGFVEKVDELHDED